MANMYIWTEGSWTKGVVASEEKIISFKYLTEHSHIGITVSNGVMPLMAEKALIYGKLVESLLPEYYSPYEKFLLTCPSSGIWKLMSDNTWVNHK